MFMEKGIIMSIILKKVNYPTIDDFEELVD